MTPIDASAGLPGVRALVLVVLGVMASGARSELVGTHPHRNGPVHLMTEACRRDDPGAGNVARQTVGGRLQQGCWGVDGAGNPVVTWSDGRELELDGNKVRLSRRMAALLEDRAPEPLPGSPAKASTKAARPRAAPDEPSPRSATAPSEFPRPAWCPEARFPHERLVCADAALAERDLRLASLWRPYRSTLSRAAQAWHKSDYFRRLKTCGSDKACIVREQETQTHRYREALSAGG